MEKRIEQSTTQPDEYRVTWEMSVVADSPEAAAREADNIRATSRWARVYDVFDVSGNKTRVDIDELNQEGRAA